MDDLEKKIKLAKSEDLSKDVFDILSKEHNRDVLLALVENPKCPSDVLKRILYNNEHEIDIVRAIAKNPNCNRSTFDELLRFDDYNININVLENPNCPPSILYNFINRPVELSEEKYEYTESMLINNSAKMGFRHLSEKLSDFSASLDTLIELAELPLPEYFESIIKNPKCNIYVLYKLYCNKYSNEEIKQKYLDIPEEELVKLSNSKDELIRMSVAGHPKCPFKELFLLANDSSEMVRKAVAGNPICPKELLIKISKDESVHVKVEVVRNLKCPIEIIDDWCKKRDKPNRELYRKYRYIKPETEYVVRILRELLNDKDLPVERIGEIINAAHIPEEIKIKAINHKNCSLETVVNAISYTEGKVRELVMDILIKKASSNKTTKEEFETLSRIKNPYIVSLILKNDSCPNDVFLKIAKNYSYILLPNKAKKRLDGLKNNKFTDISKKEEENKEEEKITNILEEVKMNKDKIIVPEEQLIIEVNDHREINPSYLNVIRIIDFSNISCDNLKVSGTKDYIIDWSESNLVIDPEIIYNKDLSNTIISKNNIIANTDFSNVILLGCDMSRVTVPLVGMSLVVLDERTKLPEPYCYMYANEVSLK